MQGKYENVGTSGYAYKEWKGIFYPEKISPKEMLRFYSARLGAVEINNTFYHMPTKGVLSSWAEQVPDSFVFALKAPQVITHIKRLRNVSEENLRLRRSDYTDADLSQWIERILSQRWERAFVFFKHEEEAKGAEMAMRFRELAEGVSRIHTCLSVSHPFQKGLNQGAGAANEGSGG